MATGTAAKSLAKPQPAEYWFATREPLVSLVFLAPLLLLYEAGVLLFGGPAPETIRNGADYWMRGWLAQAGLTGEWPLPALVVGVLLVWHLIGKYAWRVSAETLLGMFAESLLFAFVLVVLGQIQGVAFNRMEANLGLAAGLKSISAPVITYTGAGLYEEVLFRLCLLPAAYLLFRGVQLSKGWSAGLAVVATSLLFAAAHYVGGDAYELTLFSFTFRTLAGLFFAGLFVVRGFGITVGCHAAYDLLVGMLLVPAV